MKNFKKSGKREKPAPTKTLPSGQPEGAPRLAEKEVSPAGKDYVLGVLEGLRGNITVRKLLVP